MSSRRPLMLMAVLLLLIGAYLWVPAWQALDSQPKGRRAEPPLPGENSISNLSASRNDAGEWQVEFDYYYTGVSAWIRVHVDGVQTGYTASEGVARLYELTRGSNHAVLELSHPGAKTTTRQIIVEMRTPGGGESPLARAQIDQLIEWPTFGEWVEMQEFARQSPQENLDRAIALIDSEQAQAYEEAKHILERLIQRDASFDVAYIELARVAMKTNWGPEGLHHAEGLLSSALQIKPDSANAKILLGYVYTHQKRYKAAEKLFAEAAATDPPNLWLWANWGEVLVRQGKFDAAIAKYREAVERPATLKTYERARFDAYGQLLMLLERKNDLDGMEALYKRAVETFGYSSCHGLKYARFLLQQRGNAEASIEITRKALDVNCSQQDARELFGLAHYVAWSKREGASRLEALNQARIYLPPGANAIYLLARSETTVKAASQLVAAGENIDNKDNSGLNALAHAVQDQDAATARRLLRLGASPATPVGYGDVPVALMAVMGGNLELVKLMRQFGADYGKLTFQGATAFDYAKQTGDPELLKALEPTPRTL